MKFYKYNSNPLEEVNIGDLVDGDLYINDEGTKLLYKEDEGMLEILQKSALRGGEKVIDLDEGQRPKSLGLYWYLMEKEGRK